MEHEHSSKNTVKHFFIPDSKVPILFDSNTIFTFPEGLAKSVPKFAERRTGRSPYLSIKEAASYLGYSLNYLRKLTPDRKIPCYKPKGGKLFFLKEELDEWVKKGRPSAPSDIEDRAADYIMKNRKGPKRGNKK